MKRMIKFPSIEQFRNIISNVTHMTRYNGKDENGNVIYTDKPLPKISVTISEKIHGSNAAVAYNNVDGMWCQSRKSIITPKKDNAGFAFFAEGKKDVFLKLIKELANKYNVNLDESTVVLYGEWAGGNIQKNSALSGLDKHFIIFEHFKVAPVVPDVEVESKWFKTDGIDAKEHKILNIMNFKTWETVIDFEKPKESQNFLVKLVDEIEQNSPVGKELGKDGNIGEGVVVSVWYKDSLMMFKVKGDKHSNSKVKKLKDVSPEALEKEKKATEFANYATPAWRLEQMFNELQGVDGLNRPLNIKDTGTFIKAVISDVLKEESDILREKGLEIKDVSGKISRIASVWFREELNKQVGL